MRRILELENQVTALRARNAELRGQVAELTETLEATISSLRERRPNLPAIRPPDRWHRSARRTTPSADPAVFAVSVTCRAPSR